MLQINAISTPLLRIGVGKSEIIIFYLFLSIFIRHIAYFLDFLKRRSRYLDSRGVFRFL